MKFSTMHWFTYIIPKTILKTGSSYNRDIRVVEESGEYKLLVNGSTETGPYIKKLLIYAFKKFNISKEKNVNTILVLGVAGGRSFTCSILSILMHRLQALISMQ